jgi:hypothetical protein
MGYEKFYGRSENAGQFCHFDHIFTNILGIFSAAMEIPGRGCNSKSNFAILTKS